jgi:hypothetical protein
MVEMQARDKGLRDVMLSGRQKPSPVVGEGRMTRGYGRLARIAGIT